MYAFCFKSIIFIAFSAKCVSFINYSVFAKEQAFQVMHVFKQVLTFI